MDVVVVEADRLYPQPSGLLGWCRGAIHLFMFMAQTYGYGYSYISYLVLLLCGQLVLFFIW